MDPLITSIQDKWLVLDNIQNLIDFLYMLKEDHEKNPTHVISYGSYGVDSIEVIQTVIDKLRYLDRKEHEDELAYETELGN